MMKPIVLHHGMFGFDVIRIGMLHLHYWNGIDTAIAARGNPVLTTRVHPSAGVARRAGQLKAQILDWLGRAGMTDEQVVIIAHSTGGMDARYMITRLDMAERVSALVTIGTGHQGSSYFEWVVRNLDSFGQLSLIDAAALDIDAFWDAAPGKCRRLSEELPDMPGVRYYSIAGLCREPLTPDLLFSYGLIGLHEGDNDSRVSLASARWGTFLGVWPVHHFHLINWPLNYFPGYIPEDVTPRYLQLLDRLGTEGVLDTAREVTYALAS